MGADGVPLPPMTKVRCGHKYERRAAMRLSEKEWERAVAAAAAKGETVGDEVVRPRKWVRMGFASWKGTWRVKGTLWCYCYYCGKAGTTKQGWCRDFEKGEGLCAEHGVPFRFANTLTLWNAMNWLTFKQEQLGVWWQWGGQIWIRCQVCNRVSKEGEELLWCKLTYTCDYYHIFCIIYGYCQRGLMKLEKGVKSVDEVGEAWCARCFGKYRPAEAEERLKAIARAAEDAKSRARLVEEREKRIAEKRERR